MEPALLDREFLMRFPEFAEFIRASAPKPRTSATEVSPSPELGRKEQTPEETIDQAHAILHSALKADLLDRVKKIPPFRFEQLVLDLLIAMGYGGGQSHKSLP